jgi:hypothetical protein
VAGVDGAGLTAVLAYLAVVAASTTLLLRRYRWLER